MVVGNYRFDLFGRHNHVGPKSANTANQAFIDTDTDPCTPIEDATVLREKPFIYTRNSQNNSENPERFFSAQENSFNFSKSAPFSQAATVNVAKFYSDRSFGNGSNKYGPSGSSSFGSSNREVAQVGRQFASIA
jgi:hypothetical protein